MKTNLLNPMLVSLSLALATLSIANKASAERYVERWCFECYADLAEGVDKIDQTVCKQIAQGVLDCLRICTLAENIDAATDVGELSQQCLKSLESPPGPVARAPSQAIKNLEDAIDLSRALLKAKQK